MATASVALDSARSYLNDVSKSIWKDQVLLPHLKEAYGDMLLLLFVNGLPVLKEKSATISVNTGVVSLVSVSLQPLDLIEPISIKERAYQSSEDWIDMEERDFEPDIRQQTSLVYWCWREESINFVGATTPRDILLRYWKSLTAPISENSTLGFIFAELFLGPQTAGYAAKSVGNITLADENFSAAQEKMDLIIRGNIKGQQNMVSRRIPYRRSQRTRMLL